MFGKAACLPCFLPAIKFSAAQTDGRGKGGIEMEFERVTPESVGIRSQAVVDMLDELYRCGIEMHSFMLLRHGKVCAEGSWKPYDPKQPHIMFSFSKSLTSTAIGFAEQEGILSLDERLIDIFPEKAPKDPSENLQKATVRHLLMMGCGHESEIPNLGLGDPDWIASFLAHPFVYEPGTHFLYNTAGTNLLSAILTRKTGMTLTEFLRPRLIQPLGLSDIRCHALPDGTEIGGAGYSLTIEDMARFVQFVANKGSWEGKQLLREAWFDQATTKQIDNKGAGWGGDPDWQQGYCFQFWRCEPQGVFRGDGAFGQYGVVFTQQDALLVIQSSSLRLQAVLTAVWEKLLPGMEAEALPQDHKSFHVLQNRLKHLELNPMLGMRNPGAEASLNGALYTADSPLPCMADIIGGVGKFQPEEGSLNSLGFVFEGDDVRLHCVQDDGAFDLLIGMNGHFLQTEVNGVIFGANGRWRAKDKLEVELRNVRMAGGKRFVFQFAGSKMTVTADSTVPEIGGLADPLTPAMTFTLTEGDVSTKTKMYWEE